MHWEEAFSRLSGVRDEFEAAKFSVAYAQSGISAGEGVLKAGAAVKPSHLRRCAENLEMTYLLRLFAAFEGVLRDYWRVARPSPRPRRTQMEILIDRVAILCIIPSDTRDEAHEVREYRNSLVHSDQTNDAAILDFQECKSRLGRFLGCLPTRW